MKNQLLTVADANPATANPNRSGTLSCALAFLGSHTPQQNQMSVAVARNSMANACGKGTDTCGLVTQTEAPDFARICVGVRVTSNP